VVTLKVSQTKHAGVGGETRRRTADRGHDKAPRANALPNIMDRVEGATCSLRR
jgi:hypothetical protein